MTAQAPCAKIARRDPDLADRMWATITVGGREVVDAEKRALGRRVCATCPLRTTCIADSLVGGWKDRNLIGGLDYRRRTVLSKLVCRDLGITARQLHAVYWRNKRLGHPKAVGLLIQYARAWAARNPGETAIGRLQARKTPMTQGRRP